MALDLALIVPIWFGAQMLWHHMPTSDRLCVRPDLSGLSDNIQQFCQYAGVDGTTYHWLAGLYFTLTISGFIFASWYLFIRRFAIQFAAVFNPPPDMSAGWVRSWALACWLAMMLLGIFGYLFVIFWEPQAGVMSFYADGTGSLWHLGWIMLMNFGLMVFWVACRRPHYHAQLVAQRGQWKQPLPSLFTATLLSGLSGFGSG